ncbi:MAG: SDR family NAD(P)-dependent oxidoreductase [Sulfurospirillum sp.]|nr:MAG: SDR family NAD(P)-dependent oxidoreductase [Sulfurospirillum sp.]
MKKNRKVVLITGCSSGMGRESAYYLSKNGYTVYAGSRTPEKLSDIASENLVPIALDITDQNSVARAVQKLERIDVLVNNAGYGLVSTVEEVSEAEMLRQFDVNLFGVLRMCKAVIPLMRREKAGVIVNISSFLGKIGLPLFTLYNASKYALEGVTDSLRYELRPFGIRVHSIMPGFFDTNFARDNLVVNEGIRKENSPYAQTVSQLLPLILEQINHGNDAAQIAVMLHEIIQQSDAPARRTAGDKARKFIPMRRELSDEDFERRVRSYYGI